MQFTDAANVRNPSTEVLRKGMRIRVARAVDGGSCFRQANWDRRTLRSGSGLLPLQVRVALACRPCFLGRCLHLTQPKNCRARVGSAVGNVIRAETACLPSWGYGVASGQSTRTMFFGRFRLQETSQEALATRQCHPAAEAVPRPSFTRRESAPAADSARPASRPRR